ncbi:hypothetical protein LINPERHAP2_LOCUS15643 [Linum perenne]
MLLPVDQAWDRGPAIRLRR